MNLYPQKIHLSFFILISIFSCEGMTLQKNSEMEKDVQKAVRYFCESQQKQMEISQKMANLKDKQQLPLAEIEADATIVNNYLEKYTNELQKITEKYKGQEREYASLIKKAQQNCK